MAEFSLDLNEEQRDLRDWVHGFAAEVVRPAAAEWDAREETPWPIIQEAAKIGLYGFEFLANCWADPTGLSLPIANEELFWGDAGIGLSHLRHLARGRRDLRLRHARPAGRVGAAVLRRRRPTRRSPRSAAPSRRPAPTSRAMRTRAVYDEATDEWVLNGQKAYATNGGIADVHVVTASVDPALGSRGPGRVRRPAGHARAWPRPGSSRSSGLRASHTADVFLDDVRVPGRCLLGGKDALDERLARARSGQRASGQAAMRTFELSRPTVGAQALGIARAAYEYALDYAKNRVQFGRPIIENQAIAFALADMRMEIDAARLLVWRAAWMGRNNRPFTAGEGSMSKLKAGEVAVAVTEKAVQILGGAGYLRDHPVERWYRDAKIYTIFEGTSRDPAAGHLPGHLRACQIR